jgi:hypothetical protein
VGEITLYESQRVQRHVAPFGLFGSGTVRAKIHPSEQSLVAQHLLEVRHVPVRVDAVASETAAKVIVDTAPGHRVKGALDAFATRIVREVKERFDEARTRELRGGAKPAFAVSPSEESFAQEVTSVAHVEWRTVATDVVEKGDLAFARCTQLSRLILDHRALGRPRVVHRQ